MNAMTHPPPFALPLISETSNLNTESTEVPNGKSFNRNVLCAEQKPQWMEPRHWTERRAGLRESKQRASPQHIRFLFGSLPPQPHGFWSATKAGSVWPGRAFWSPMNWSGKSCTGEISPGKGGRNFCLFLFLRLRIQLQVEHSAGFSDKVIDSNGKQ